MPILDSPGPGQPSWQSVTHQQSLLAGFPSLGLGLGALAPDEGRIACRNRERWSEAEALAVRASGTTAARCHLQSDQQAPSSPWPSVATPQEVRSSWGEGRTVENPGEAGQREEAPRGREEEQPRGSGPGRRGVMLPDPRQAHTTPRGLPPSPTQKVRTTDPAPSPKHYLPGSPPGGAPSNCPCCVDRAPLLPPCGTGACLLLKPRSAPAPAPVL